MLHPKMLIFADLYIKNYFETIVDICGFMDKNYFFIMILTKRHFPQNIDIYKVMDKKKNDFITNDLKNQASPQNVDLWIKNYFETIVEICGFMDKKTTFS